MVLWNGVNRIDRIDRIDRIGQAGPATELRLHGQTFYTSVVRAGAQGGCASPMIFRRSAPCQSEINHVPAYTTELPCFGACSPRERR